MSKDKHTGGVGAGSCPQLEATQAMWLIGGEAFFKSVGRIAKPHLKQKPVPKAIMLIVFNCKRWASKTDTN